MVKPWLEQFLVATQRDKVARRCAAQGFPVQRHDFRSLLPAARAAKSKRQGGVYQEQLRHDPVTQVFRGEYNVVYICTELKVADSWFLPFNRGINGGAGNPLIPGKTMTSDLWEEILTKPSLSNIIENFAQVIIIETDKKTHKQKKRVIWPR